MPKNLTAFAWPALVLAGLWARLAHWQSIFPGGKVLLIPADTHYYLRFAQLQLEAFPRFVSFDPYVNFPQGAFITWPPLHTLLITAALALTRPENWEHAVAWVGPAISAVELSGLAWVCHRVLGHRGLWALAIVALAPIAAEGGAVGQADHHVHEPALALLIPLLQWEALKSKDLKWALACGVALGAGRMFTSMAFAFVPPVAIAFALALESDRGALKAALVCGASALVTSFLGVAAFGRLGSMLYVDHSAFHPALVACAFAVALGAATLIHDVPRRWALAALLVALGTGALLTGEVVRAVSHLMRRDPLLAWVDESKSPFDDLAWPMQMLQLAPLAWALFGVGLWKLWRAGERQVWSVAVMAVCVAMAAMSQLRFLNALTGAMAACAAGAAGWELCAPGLKRVLQGAAFFGCASLTVSMLPHGEAHDDFAQLRPVLESIRKNSPPPGDPPQYAVLATEPLGHALVLWAQRPAVASTFSQAPWHVEGNARAHRFFFAENESAALAAAVATRARYVVTVEKQEKGFGAALHASSGSAHFRLVHEGSLGAAKVFEVVP